MSIIKVTGGWETYTGTNFGRHYHVFQALQDELEGREGDLRCLIIGPGRKGELSCFDINTYQPFELMNAIRNCGLEAEIDVFDISDRVLDEMRKRPARMHVPKNFWLDYHLTQEDESGQRDQQRYFNQFFPDCVVEDREYERQIEIPDDVMSSFNLINGDVVVDDLAQYDLVVCTVVLSYYSSAFTHDGEFDFPGLLQKVRSSAQEYLIASFSGGEEFELLVYSSKGRMGSVHTESASLLKRVSGELPTE